MVYIEHKIHLKIKLRLDNFYFWNQNTLLNIGKCHSIAFYDWHWVEMVKTLRGVRPRQEFVPCMTPL